MRIYDLDDLIRLLSHDVRNSVARSKLLLCVSNEHTSSTTVFLPLNTFKLCF